MILIRALFALLFCGVAVVAEARVFTMNNESFAPYISGSWGPSLENTLNSSSDTTSGVPVTLNSRHTFNSSGEFGLVYATPQVNMRFGLEFLRPSEIKDRSGTDSSGASLYSLNSEISVLIPKFALELSLKKWNTTRVYLGLGAGYGNLAARNSYSFTAAGNSAYPGMTDFYEDLRGNAPMYEGSLGFESLLTDSTTYTITAGYRNLNFTSIKHNRDVTTFQGSVSKGDIAKNIDGTDRTLNLSNFFVGIGLRFWLY